MAETDGRAAQLLERALHTLHARTSATTGEAYLRALVLGAAEVVGARWAFLGTFLAGSPTRVRTVAGVRDGQRLEDAEYDLAGTPCQVMGTAVCQVTEGAARRYPDAAFLADHHVESYLGIAVPGADGRPVGVLVALDERPMAPMPELGDLFGAFAARAGAELDRISSRSALEASESRFRQIVTCCAEGVAILDGAGVVRYANPQLARMLGAASSEELQGRSYREFTAPSQLTEVGRRLERRRAGLADRYETQLVCADGREILVDISAAPVPAADGRISSTIALFRDITEQRALDEQVREAQKLESLGVLAGGVAHEFNNLLVGILANASYALSELPVGEVQAAVEDARASAQKASELTRQLLAYSGRGTYTVGPVDLNRVATEMAALAAPALKKVRVLQELAPGLPEVQADAGQVGQVIMNLLTNAADAQAGHPGAVTLRTSLAQVDRMGLAHFHGGQGLEEGPYLVLEVADQGAGMDEVTRARVFEPFFSTKFAGRGLGLAAALGILRGHRGAMRVESEPGRGSRFTVLLPPRVAGRADEPEVGPAGGPGPAPAPVPSDARPLVLVADDEEVVRRAARRALERGGFAVLEAADGLVAVERFRAEAARVACVILDLTMPGMGGEAALAAIRQVSDEVPVVLTSGFTDRDEASEEATGRRVSFLPKPFGPADLVGAVRAALGLGPAPAQRQS
ncbi:MAG: response regulator [Anaeromyxobacter sp.]|nr:response regulator [Anaeromyxobacter sp.]MBL0275257.1 response regulator [Anaeromyxobacter sp.]